MARLACVFHAQLVGLRIQYYGEWVPSKANPADVPTRPDRWDEFPPEVTWVPMVLPPVAAMEADFEEWIARSRAS